MVSDIQNIEQEKTVARVSFLGGFELKIGDLVLTDELNRSMKLWNLLTYLIAHRGRSIPQSEFIEMLWPDEMEGNPISALKTLFFRIRKMLATVFGEETKLIVSRYNSYAWNKEIECIVDAEEFEKNCRAASNPLIPVGERLELYSEALRLYKGDFLPKLSQHLWTISFKTHFHTIYMAAVRELADILHSEQKFEEMSQVCLKAVQIDPYDENMHTLMLKSLLAQGKNAAALSHYERATDFLYRNLGVHPSQELRDLYAQIMDMKKSLETDLTVIQNGLSEQYQSGAFVCEFGFFQQVYRVACRLAARTGVSVHVVLFTLSNKDGSAVDLDVLAGAMNQLLQDARAGLRRVDIISRYSGAQYLVILPRANYEDSIMVSERISSAFAKHYRYRKLRLICRIQPLNVEVTGPAAERPPMEEHENIAFDDEGGAEAVVC